MQDKISLILEALVADFIKSYQDSITPDLLEHFIKNADANIIPDNVFCDYSNIEKISWNKIPRVKLIRLLSRMSHGEIIMPMIFILNDKNLINLLEYNFSIKEVENILKFYPDSFDLFNFDIESIDKKYAFILLSCGNEYFLEKVDLDIFEFSILETFEIIKAFNFSVDILKQFNLFKLNSFYWSEILINIENKYSWIVPKDLTPKDWLKLLEKKPEFLKECDFTIFKNGDIYYLIEFCILFPEYKEFLYDKDFSEISPLGWKKLIEHFPEMEEERLSHLTGFQTAEMLISKINTPEFLPLNKLNTRDWLRVLKSRPELLSYCNFELFENGSIYELIDLSIMFPPVSYLLEKRGWGEITSFGWEKLLIHDPEKYINYCDISRISNSSWNKIIKKRPELKDLR